MLYLNNMVGDAENGFLNLNFESIYLPIPSLRLSLFVYHRQGQFLVLLVDPQHEFQKQEVKLFFDKNLSLYNFEKSKNNLAKEEVHYFICNDTNGLSTENMFTYR